MFLQCARLTNDWMIFTSHVIYMLINRIDNLQFARIVDKINPHNSFLLVSF